MFDSTGIITAMILVCLALIALVILAKPLKIFIRLLVNAAVGCGIITVLSSLGLNIGVNALTAVFVGFLGLPGLAGLVALQFLL